MAVRTCRVSIMTVLAHRAEFPTNDRYTWRRKFWPPSTEEGAWSSVGTVSSLPVLHAGTDVLKRSPQAWARSSSIRTIGFLSKLSTIVRYCGYLSRRLRSEHVFVGILDHVRLSMNQDVGQVGPFLFVMVDDECDAWILRYIAHPLEPGAGQALGILVNHEIKVRDLVEPEANRDIVRDGRVIGRGEPGDTRKLKEIP